MALEVDIEEVWNQRASMPIDLCLAGLGIPRFGKVVAKGLTFVFFTRDPFSLKKFREKSVRADL